MKFGERILWSIGALLLAAAPALAVDINPGTSNAGENDKVQLNAGVNGNDPGCRYSWSQTGGPAALNQTNGGGGPKHWEFVTPTVSANTILTFRVDVTNCNTSSKNGFATATVNVLNGNSAPTAAITVSPGEVYEGTAVTLDGSSSTDPDGDSLTYSWEQVGGPRVDLSDTTGPTVFFTAPNDAYSTDGASLTFRLTVSDGNATVPAETTVTVRWLNDPPTAQISCTPAAVDERASVRVDGSTSKDSDGSISSYAWSQPLGYGGITPTLPSDVQTSFFDVTAPSLTSKNNTMTFGLTVTDNGGLTSTQTCTVTVNDITPPVFANLPADMVVEAQSSSGAAVTFDPTATDAVDDVRPVTCTPGSGSTFALDTTTTVQCSASDTALNQATASFTVTVVDTTPPKIAPHDPVTAEATGPSGSAVLYASPETTDAVDGTGVATCLPASGSTFALGETTVTCTAMDAAGNVADPTSFTVSVVDTTPPALTLPGSIGPVEGNTLGGATVTFATSASDLVDGTVEVTCDAASGSVFPVGPTTVSCSAVDTRGNRATGSFAVTVVDTTPPVVTLGGTIVDGDSFIFGSAPPAPTCTAVDLVSGGVPCTVSGYSDKVGSHTLTGAASDTAGNTGTATRSYTVLPWTLTGFYRPVEMGGITNTVKNGSTVPLKFEVFAGSEEKTGIAAIASIQTRSVACQSLSSSEDPVDALATGGTLLRYDATAGQFIFNWQTPKTPGSCYVVTATTLDGSTISANFKLK